MSHQTLTKKEFEAIAQVEKKKPEKVVERITTIIKKVPQISINFVDSLAFLVVASIYFFFTGLAILFGRPIPKFWIDLSKIVETHRIKDKITEKVERNKIKDRAGKIRIVDIESGQQL